MVRWWLMIMGLLVVAGAVAFGVFVGVNHVSAHPSTTTPCVSSTLPNGSIWVDPYCK